MRASLMRANTRLHADQTRRHVRTTEEYAGVETAVLAGDPSKPGLYVVMAKWLAGNHSADRIPSARPLRHRAQRNMAGRQWHQV